MKKWIKRAALLLIVFFVILAAYAGYVLTDYYRLPDNLTIEVKRNGENFYFEEDTAYKAGEYYWIMTYNIGFGAYQNDFSFFMDGGKSSWAKDEESVIATVSGIGELITTVNPDFVLLQEADVDGTRSYHVNQLDLLNHFVKGYYYTFAQNYDSPFLFYPFLEPHGANQSGIVTYSKAAITDCMRRSLPISQTMSRLVDLDRCYSISRIPLENGKSLCLYNVHLSAYSTDEIRQAQLTMLYEDMQKDYSNGNYVICGGDFNHDLRDPAQNAATDISFFPRETLPEGFKMAIDEPRDKADIAHDTCRSAAEPYREGTTPTYTLDGFIVSDNVVINYYHHMNWNYQFSDHEPVIMQFKLAGE